MLIAVCFYCTVLANMTIAQPRVLPPRCTDVCTHTRVCDPVQGCYYVRTCSQPCRN